MGLVISLPDYQRFVFDKSRRSAVLANGCFDILHRGHIQLLERAAQLGSPLVVGLNSDKSVEKLKGPARPIVPQVDRAEVLAALSFVSFVIIFDGDLVNLIDQIKPAVLVKGSDWAGKNIIEYPAMKALGGTVELIPIVSLQSTSKIIANYEQRCKDRDYHDFF